MFQSFMNQQFRIDTTTANSRNPPPTATDRENPPCPTPHCLGTPGKDILLFSPICSEFRPNKRKRIIPARFPSLHWLVELSFPRHFFRLALILLNFAQTEEKQTAQQQSRRVFCGTPSCLLQRFLQTQNSSFI